MHAPVTKPKPFCFVLMPFDSAFSDVYEYGIKGACTDVDVYCERVDEQIFIGSMLDRIYNQIARADIIVADMTGRNENVFYEVGYAHALGKTVILLTQRAEDIPFDLKHFPHIVYSAKIKELRVELAKRIQYFAFEIVTTKTHQISLELYWEGRLLTAGNVVGTYVKSPDVNITIHNPSAITYHLDDFSVGVITSPEISVKHESYSRLPDGRYLYVLSPSVTWRTLFPGTFFSIYFNLELESKVYEPKLTDFNILFRLFSSDGYRDFPFGLRKTRSDGG